MSVAPLDVRDHGVPFTKAEATRLYNENSKD